MQLYSYMTWTKMVASIAQMTQILGCFFDTLIILYNIGLALRRLLLLNSKKEIYGKY